MLRRFAVELGFLLLGALYLSAWWTGSLLGQIVLGMFLVTLAAILLVRWGRKLVWRLRDRLILAYIFTAVVPILVVLGIAMWATKEIGGQIAVYLVNQELDRRVSTLAVTAESLARSPDMRRKPLLDAAAARLRDRFPGIQILEDDRTPSPADGASGVVAKDRLLYLWAVASGAAGPHRTRVTMLAPLSRSWLAALSPGLGPVSIIDFDAASGRESFRLHTAAAGAEDSAGAANAAVAVPAAENRFDLEVRWASRIAVTMFDAPTSSRSALLGVRSRLSAVLRALFSIEREQPLKTFLVALLLVFGFVEIVSIYIGISVTRAITGAVSDLYEGTQHVKRGDLSHRIPVKGTDQIADLSASFNQMTKNVEELLAVAREKERMDAELAIARQVQEQLFPRQAPPLTTLELTAVCRPARTVSGDYYDYQSIGPGRVALALADVAGKGASAALLMASLQACLRMQVGDPDKARSLSAADLVARTNRQLHANTSAEKFATFFFAVYDDESGLLTYCNAGHLPPILVRRGEARLLDVNGMVVGAFPFARYEESRLQLEAGDLLVAYSDGITEPENDFGEMFGEQRLIDLVVRNAHLDPTSLIALVNESVVQFAGGGEQQDDMTLMIARRK